MGSPIDIERTATDGDISLGRELRRAREVRGITVQQIAHETKINERYIHALENDRFDLLPGQPYTANFVRSIARCIGADEEELIDYLQYHLRMLQPERRDDARSSGGPRPRSGMPLVLAVGAVLVIVALTLALRGDPDGKKSEEGRRGSDRPAISAPAVASAPVSADPAASLGSGAISPGPAATSLPAPQMLAGMSAPVAATVTAPAPATASAASAPAPSAATASAPPSEPAPTVRLVWRARGWIEADQQGEPYVRMHDAGDEASWTLDRPLTLQIGNSGKVDMYIDGQLAKPLGSDNETRRLSLDLRNWRSFLR